MHNDMPLDQVLQGNALEILPSLPAESVDLVFIDPPYNLQLGKKQLKRWSGTQVQGVTEQWDRFGSYEEYDRFVESLLSEVRRVMKPNATLWIIGSYHCIFRIGKILMDLGFWILNDVIWYKTNPMPNWLGTRFCNATETLIWAVKDKSVKDYTFHLDVAREYAEGDLATNVWRIPICSGKERLNHPTQKPEALLERIIRISSSPGDVVLDPMAGSGTTGAVAQSLGRHFILIEQREDYVNIIKSRLSRNHLRLM